MCVSGIRAAARVGVSALGPLSHPKGHHCCTGHRHPAGHHWNCAGHQHPAGNFHPVGHYHPVEHHHPERHSHHMEHCHPMGHCRPVGHRHPEGHCHSARHQHLWGIITPRSIVTLGRHCHPQGIFTVCQPLCSLPALCSSHVLCLCRDTMALCGSACLGTGTSPSAFSACLDTWASPGSSGTRSLSPAQGQDP